MFYQGFNEWANLGKTMFGPFYDLQQMNAKVLEQFTRECLDAGSHNVATMVKYAQSANKPKKAEEGIKAQVECISDLSRKSLEFTQNACKILQDSLKDYTKWFESNVNEAYKEDSAKK